MLSVAKHPPKRKEIFRFAQDDNWLLAEPVEANDSLVYYMRCNIKSHSTTEIICEII